MAEILININDVEEIINSYGSIDSTFSVISRAKVGTTGTRYNFVIKSQSCTIVVYDGKKSVKVIPEGRNRETALEFIKYIENKGLNPKVNTKQHAFKCSSDFCDNMKDYFELVYPYNIKCEAINNKYVFTGYNRDKITIHQFADKILVQGKPLYVYSLVISYIAENLNIPLEEFIESLKDFNELNSAVSAIRMTLSKQIGDSYSYLDEVLLRCISSSYCMLKKFENGEHCEDYSGCLTGVFKALEGYLKKVLQEKYGFVFRNTSFEMFKKASGKPINFIDGYEIYSDVENQHFSKLYSLYKNKRNTYLHAKTVVSSTAVIDTFADAKSFYLEIVKEIKDSYEVFK